MICDVCKSNEAVIYVEQTSRLGIKKINLCQSCAANCGISPGNHEIEKQIGSLFKQMSKQKREHALKSDCACPVCGQLCSEFLATGKLGCPECYAIFKTEIDSYLSKRKITSRYTGSMPRRLSNFRSVLTDRAVIREKLEAAVKNEDYEKAAFYRDYLLAIEKKAVATSPGLTDEGEEGER